MLDYLGSAKNQMEYGDGSFRESALNLSVASARFLLLNRTPIDGSYLESVDKVNSTDLRRAAGKFLSGKKWAVLAITPLAGEGTMNPPRHAPGWPAAGAPAGGRGRRATRLPGRWAASPAPSPWTTA